jgi:hypothetical protein
MSILKLYIRSFHPLSNFGLGGLGYHGDNRGFKHDPGATARIFAIVRIDLANARIVKETIDSNASSGLTGILTQDYKDPATKPHFTAFSGTIDPYRDDGDQGGQLLIGYTGQNFAMPMADRRVPETVPFTDWRIPVIGGKTGRELVYESVVPGLDVTTSLGFEIDRDAKTMSFQFRMVGDGFPNAEAFLIDASDGPLMLATHRRIGSALHQLRGDRRIAMASSGARVGFDNERFTAALTVFWCLDYAEVTGGPIDVRAETGKQPNSRLSWNAMHTQRDAKGGWGRYALGDTLPTYAPGRPGSSMP